MRIYMGTLLAHTAVFYANVGVDCCTSSNVRDVYQVFERLNHIATG